MVIVSVRMTVSPDRRDELVQTIRCLYGGERARIKGLVEHRVYRDMDEENALRMLQEWETGDDLDEHLGSDTFRVFMGALNVLTESREIRFRSVSERAGQEAVRP